MSFFLSTLLKSVSTPGRKTGIQHHSAVDHQGGAVDIIGFILGKPYCRRTDVPGVAHPVPGDEFEQLALGFRRFPRRLIDRGFYRAGRDAVDPDPIRGHAI
jgi:hypothetical protein